MLYTLSPNTKTWQNPNVPSVKFFLVDHRIIRLKPTTQLPRALPKLGPSSNETIAEKKTEKKKLSVSGYKKEV